MSPQICVKKWLAVTREPFYYDSACLLTSLQEQQEQQPVQQQEQQPVQQQELAWKLPGLEPEQQEQQQEQLL